MSSMQVFELELHLSADQMLAYYQGSAQQVLAQDIRGLRISFPAQALRPYITHDGVQGRFRLRIDDNNKLIDVQKIS